MRIDPQTPRLAPALLHAQLLTETQLQTAIMHAQKNNQSLLIYLIQQCHLDATAISQACADYFGLPHQELSDFTGKNFPISLVDENLIQQHYLLPLDRNQYQLHVGICDPDDFSFLDDIQYQTGLHVQAVMIPYDQMSTLIHQLFSKKNYAQITEDDAVAFVKQILFDAIHRNASDIHCEPMDNHYRIRMRIDGLLHEITQMPTQATSAITCRLKVLAQCDIAERRLPQDGRFTFTTRNSHARDCRLSSCPTLFGEKIVVRLLDPNKKLLSFDELGLDAQEQSCFLKALAQPQGLILVTGPTGSGKTITLYTALQYLNKKTHNISTVEEPVEIQLAGINQVNIHEKAGLTFASVLRALLRQDPDIIMVGEIRDKETAEIAVRAAQTGHLVLSTLHTNSAADTVIRLLNMGIAPFNLAGSLRLIVAQRLIRKLCTHCKQADSPEIPSPCSHCTGGYQGRTGVFELMPISKKLSALILQEGAKAPIEQCAGEEGMRNLWQAALEKVSQGVTNLPEIYRVVSHDH